MAQNETFNRDLIISRIKKLLKHAESAKSIGSLAEAEAFSAKAQQLLMEYNISMMDVNKAADKDEDQFANWQYGETIPYSDLSGNRWKLDLIRVITRYNLCSFTYNDRAKTFRVYGHVVNVDTVVWLFHFMSTALLRLSKDSYCALNKMEREGTTRRRYIQSFLLGAVSGIDAKLREQKEEQKRNAKMYEVIVYNAKALDTYAHTKIPGLVFRQREKRRLDVDYRGYEKGKEAGRNLKVNSPLNTPRQTKKLN